ncbi:CRISPR-associated endoribonuclease Cas6 [Microcoleus sp. LEGE 07076]|uniref:CRISPR-associated endoribonuclease Cas6 n=1 Tax=Microcoleus sp. LEGE 07076 TaxID=915322 RepID=UPI0018818D34|nr:CRISPR-associated endoribonuclease Cas6 [Microcoleus sp. LEGE 07076]MBE9187470.1 CRISPR-associated endoribonuclease Cas6 [Microcoleus sp. LEGE 07076]
MATSPHPALRKKSASSELIWPADTELVGLVFELTPRAASSLYAQYAIGLHAWFLGQVHQTDPDLSQLLHDEESEKAFTISGLEGDLRASGKEFQLVGDRIYRWYITGLSQRVVQWLNQWLQNLPQEIDLRNAPLVIRSWEIAFAPTTYQQLLTAEHPLSRNIKLSFVTPTSFRSKGHHFPLPVPENVFHSYLRRWNNFSGMNFDQAEFLTWIDENVIISRHKLESQKVAAGKKGMVTGFTGAVEFAIGRSAALRPDFVQLFYALGRLAPYCGTGHKTTFGLGQTRSQWLTKSLTEVSIQSVLAARIDELTEKFMALRKRTGGSRAAEIAETWATILARRELGESLFDIAADLEMPYETVKTYVKLARRALKVED